MSTTPITLYENLKELNESQFNEVCLYLKEAYGYDLTFVTRQGVPIARSAQELIDLLQQNSHGLNQLEEVLAKVIQGKTTSVETDENQIDKKRLIALLLECPSLRDIDTRRSLLKMLPHHIVDHIKVGNTIKEAVINIVEVCMNYPEGLKHLFNAVRFFDEKTVPFQTLSDFLDVQAFRPDISPPEVLAKVETPLTKLMAQLHLSSQMRASDEFTQHNHNSLHLIREAMVQLKQLSPQTPEYSRVSLIVGSVLSSTGELLQAERLFTQVIENTDKSDEKALAHFNLFQIQLRRKLYPKALDNLQTAIKINPHYALHDLHKYPFERLLGAGGMGCVFLCRNKNRLIRYTRVVVKCFWEHPKGTVDEVFKEPFTMRDIAGDYIPEPLDFGYVDLIKQERAYFVTAYIDDAIDGEAWLEKYGPMDLETGLQVGLQIAKGLQIAHDAGICHLDLKPANILLKQTDNEIAVRIIDFGLSQVVPSLQQKAMTLQKNHAGLSQFGQAIFGTLDYACPEQQGFNQYGKPGVQCDVFAFGMTMYRFLTGKNPRYFRERDLPKVEALRDLLGDCVEQEPNQRPESAQQLINQIENIQAIELQKPDEIVEAKIEQQAKIRQAARYTDNGDGTITDNITGLIWLKNANCFYRE
ncbi:MAG: protein kinase, partial [Candidatus Parabeggiatoa sp.]|nr:protein kinase [Candidatus Parabeggiatoa sp.]